METKEDTSETSIRTMIVNLVRTTWYEKNVGALLSQIGSLVSEHHELARVELGGRKLSSYLEEVLHDELRVIVSPQNPIVRVAIPSEVTIPDNVIELFPRADPIKKAATQSGLSKAILTAFSRPVAADKKRVIYLTPKIRFEDIASDAEVPASAKVIERELIAVPSGGAEFAPSMEQLVANITKWRTESELRPETISQKANTSGRSDRMSLLERIIEALSEQDLKHIQLPLDVVKKLLNRF